MNTPHYDSELNAILEDMHSTLYKYRAGEVARRCQLAVELIQCAKLTQDDWMKGTNVYRGPGGQFVSKGSQEQDKTTGKVASALKDVQKREEQVKGDITTLKEEVTPHSGKGKREELAQKEKELRDLEKAERDLKINEMKSHRSAESTLAKDLKATRDEKIDSMSKEDVAQISKDIKAARTSVAQLNQSIPKAQAGNAVHSFADMISEALTSAGNSVQNAMDWGQGVLDKAGSEIESFKVDPKGWREQKGKQISDTAGNLGNAIKAAGTAIKDGAGKKYQEFQQEVEAWKHGEGSLGPAFKAAQEGWQSVKDSQGGKAVADAWDAASRKVAETEASIGENLNHAKQVMKNGCDSAHDTLGAMKDEAVQNGNMYGEVAAIAGSAFLDAPFADNTNAVALLRQEAATAMANIKDRMKAKATAREGEQGIDDIAHLDSTLVGEARANLEKMMAKTEENLKATLDAREAALKDSEKNLRLDVSVRQTERKQEALRKEIENNKG